METVDELSVTPYGIHIMYGKVMSKLVAMKYTWSHRTFYILCILERVTIFTRNDIDNILMIP